MRKFLIALPIALAVACGGGDASKKTDDKKATGDKKADKKADADAKGGDKKGGDAEADDKQAGGPNVLELKKLGLKAEAPAGAEAKDAIVGDGMMIQGPGIVVTVEVANDMHAKTAEDAQKDAEMYSPENWKVETLPDGYAATFDNKGGMGTNYWVQVRREINGKSYWCSTTAAQPEQQENALKTCKSLKA